MCPAPSTQGPAPFGQLSPPSWRGFHHWASLWPGPLRERGGLLTSAEAVFSTNAVLREHGEERAFVQTPRGMIREWLRVPRFCGPPTDLLCPDQGHPELWQQPLLTVTRTLQAPGSLDGGRRKLLDSEAPWVASGQSPRTVLPGEGPHARPLCWSCSLGAVEHPLPSYSTQLRWGRASPQKSLPNSRALL